MKYDPTYHPQTAESLLRKKKAGTNEELADALGVDRSTLYNWLKRYPEFKQAVDAGKRPLLDRLESAYWRKVEGYDTTSVEVVKERFSDDSLKTVKTVERTTHIPPSDTLIKMGLLNMDPANWRERRELVGPDGGPVKIQVGAIPLEELMKLDERELAKLHSEALAQSATPQCEPEAAEPDNGEGGA